MKDAKVFGYDGVVTPSFSYEEPHGHADLSDFRSCFQLRKPCQVTESKIGGAYKVEMCFRLLNLMLITGPFSRRILINIRSLQT